MISKLITSGSSVILSRSGRFYGANLSSAATSKTLTIHDTSATASAATANEIYRMTNIATTTWKNDNPGMADGKGIQFQNGLVAVLASAATAVILYE